MPTAATTTTTTTVTTATTANNVIAMRVKPANLNI
jgi:hypothetical protein